MKYNGLILLLLFGTLYSCSKEPNYHFVKINGKQQHVRTMGNGKPVVVFLNGGGSDLKDFEAVQNAISKISKTISYDKFGIGKSELTDTPRTLENVAGELKELLEMEGVINTPVILVGHSMGGYVARYYLHHYPKNIVGLVLIDPGSEFLNEAYKKLQTEKEINIEDSLLREQIKRIPKGFQMEVNAYDHHDSVLRTFSIQTEIPITLLESNKVDEGDMSGKRLVKFKKKLYREFQSKVPQTKIISTEKSGHFIQLEEPNLVIDAIRSMMEEVK